MILQRKIKTLSLQGCSGLLKTIVTSYNSHNNWTNPQPWHIKYCHSPLKILVIKIKFGARMTLYSKMERIYDTSGCQHSLLIHPFEILNRYLCLSVAMAASKKLHDIEKTPKKGRPIIFITVLMSKVQVKFILGSNCSLCSCNFASIKVNVVSGCPSGFALIN